MVVKEGVLIVVIPEMVVLVALVEVLLIILMAIIQQLVRELLVRVILEVELETLTPMILEIQEVVVELVRLEQVVILHQGMVPKIAGQTQTVGLGYSTT